jgi:hypothetical protein
VLSDGGFHLTGAKEQAGEVEPGVGVFRLQRHGCLEMAEGFRDALLLVTRRRAASRWMAGFWRSKSRE